MKKLIAAAVAATMVLPAAPAYAELVQEYSVGIKDFNPNNGAYTMRVNSYTYNSDGSLANAVTKTDFYFPYGVKMRKQFLKAPYLCSEKMLTDKGKDPKACKLLGSGRVSVDLRGIPFLAYIPVAIPADVYMYLAKSEDKNAVAAMLLLGVPDINNEYVKKEEIIASTKPIFAANLYNERSADGKYGYRMSFSVDPVAGFRISVPEIRTTVKGFTMTKKAKKCAKGKGKSCANNKKRKSVFWTTPPACIDGKINFKASYEYDGLPPQEKAVDLPCPKLKKSK